MDMAGSQEAGSKGSQRLNYIEVDDVCRTFRGGVTVTSAADDPQNPQRAVV